MGLGRQGAQQETMHLAWAELPRSRGHAFYDRLQQILRKAGFDTFAERLCKPVYADKGRPSMGFGEHALGMPRVALDPSAMFPQGGLTNSFRDGCAAWGCPQGQWRPCSIRI